MLVGSFVTGLMVWRDLDVCVAADALDRAGAWAARERVGLPPEGPP